MLVLYILSLVSISGGLVFLIALQYCAGRSRKEDDKSRRKETKKYKRQKPCDNSSGLICWFESAGRSDRLAK
jgi:hypothetical protein